MKMSCTPCVFHCPCCQRSNVATTTLMKAPPKSLPPKEPPKEQLQMIRLPLHFHLLTGFTMRAFEKDMDIRVTCEQLQAIVLPEVNRIWKQAGIAFVYKGCSKYSEPPTSGERQAISVLENANREDDEINEDLNDERMTAIRTLSIDLGIDRDDTMNVFVIPYMGSTRQGNAIERGSTSVVVGNWTNKPSGGTRPPQQTLLVEPEPFKIGSLGRTIAHELGHSLNLGHPKSDSNKKLNLMGGPSQGYKLETSQIKTSRTKAKEILIQLKPLNLI